MRMIISMFVLVAGVTAQSAVNQGATNSNCNDRTSGPLLQSTTFVEPKERKEVKPVDTQQASGKGKAQGA